MIYAILTAYIIVLTNELSRKIAPKISDVAAMEPLLPTEGNGVLDDLVVDLVGIMENSLEPRELLSLMDNWCEEEICAGRMPKGSRPLLREAVIAGDFARGQAPARTGYQERQAGTVLNTVIKRELLVSPTTRSKVRLGYPPEVVERWLARQYPVAV